MSLFFGTKPEPERKVLTAKDLRKRLMEISALVKDTKECKRLASMWPASPTKLWTIANYDNRLVDLMDMATATAQALASAPSKEVAEMGDA